MPHMACTRRCAMVEKLFLLTLVGRLHWGTRPALGCGAMGLAGCRRPLEGTGGTGYEDSRVGDMCDLSRDHGNDRSLTKLSS